MLQNQNLGAQHGVALITALLVVTLATITAVSMTTRQQLDIRRTANVLNGEQAYLYALGAESWVKRILLRDAKHNRIDSFKDVWAMPLPPLPIPGGTVEGQIEDLQGRFNLNNLVEKGQASVEDMRFFERLLRILELPPQLAQVVVDWIDNDLEAQMPDGAEDNTYLTKTPAYRTSNTLFSSPSEIRLLAGFDNDSYQKLLPYISTLPTRTPINVNTAPLPVLMALAQGLSETDASILIADREKKPFESTENFIVHNALAGLKIEAKNLSVVSAYFLLTAQVQIERARAQLSSVLYREANKIKIIMRSQGM
ncbi:MAG: general secretion pathway protein GspK [Candidatus Parabeggiatoa sp. nov. 3]|nr:MAG: general secretion pathway protein GspK [Gammaproteobacteria bacterium]RKZ65769.1 MAG: general secretion pathway protein GspK [Gammaproteobacteria bacterium]RKZ89387.1 MAG: general secretion pathway protein GspK [Gammaproteobacteria bacterium]